MEVVELVVVVTSGGIVDDEVVEEVVVGSVVVDDDVVVGVIGDKVRVVVEVVVDGTVVVDVVVVVVVEDVVVVVVTQADRLHAHCGKLAKQFCTNTSQSNSNHLPTKHYLCATYQTICIISALQITIHRGWSINRSLQVR